MSRQAHARTLRRQIDGALKGRDRLVEILALLLDEPQRQYAGEKCGLSYKLRVLLRLDVSKMPPNMDVHRTDGDFPLVWAKSHGKGRVFDSALGHAAGTWDIRDVQQMYFEAMKWALGLTDGDVTPRPLPPNP